MAKNKIKETGGMMKLLVLQQLEDVIPEIVKCFEADAVTTLGAEGFTKEQRDEIFKYGQELVALYPLTNYEIVIKGSNKEEFEAMLKGFVDCYLAMLSEALCNMMRLMTLSAVVENWQKEFEDEQLED
jgi:hypothetical protein